MQFYWVRDRIRKNHFHIFWEEGKKIWQTISQKNTQYVTIEKWYVSWSLMPSHTWPKNHRSVYMRRKGGRSVCNWRHASISAGTSPYLSPRWMNCWGWRRRQPWRVKWKQPYLNTYGYVKSRIAITLVRTTHRCIRGSWLLAHRISVQQPQCKYGSELNLFR